MLESHLHSGCEYTSEHGYASAILAYFSISIRDLSMRPVKRFLDIHPSVRRFRRLCYYMNFCMHQSIDWMQDLDSHGYIH